MPNFWSYITNGKYSVGCTGQTVYVYSAEGEGLARFKDLKYAYKAAFSPKGDIFVVKTTEGRLGIYSLDPLCLIKKFRFSKVDGSQDDNFCFSPDGELFFNIERQGESYISVLSVYRTSDFSLTERYFEEDEDLCPELIEYGVQTGSYFILGFERPTDNGNIRNFVARFSNGELCDKVYITENEREFYYWYKEAELSGFTKKIIQLLPIEFYDIDELKRKNFSLEGLWCYYKEKGIK